MTDIKTTLMTGAAAAVVIALHPVATYAQDQADPSASADDKEVIVITATRRDENVQDVPIAVNVVDELALQLIGANDFSDLVNSLSGVELRSSQSGRGGISMRGVAEVNVDNLLGATGTAVGLYLDEAPLTAGGFLPDIKSFDLQRVEVLRGPQGTLFGEGTLAGAVRLISNKPDSTGFGYAFDGSVSSFEDGGDNYAINGMVNIPLAEDVAALRIVAFQESLGGFLSANLTSGGVIEDANDEETTGWRAALRVTPSPRLTLDLSALQQEADRGVRSRATADRSLTISVPERSDDTLSVFNFTGSYEFDGMTLTSSSSLFDRELDFLGDQGGLVPGTNAILGLLQAPPPFGPGLDLTALGGVPAVSGVFANQIFDTNSFAQEIRLVSNGDGPLNWTVGAFYKDQEYSADLITGTDPVLPGVIFDTATQVIFAGTGLPVAGLIDTGLQTNTDGEVTQTAGFGEVSYRFNESFEALFGARYFVEDRTSTTFYTGLIPALPVAFGGGGLLPSIQVPATVTTDESDEIFNPRLTLTYNVNEDTLTYATISRGFRSGGQNDLFSVIPGAEPSFDSEQLTNYEVGYKSTLADGAVTFNAALYYIDWTDLQAVVGEGPGGIGEAVGNVGDASTTGVDFELFAQASENLELSFSGSLLQAEIDDSIVLPDPSTGAPLTIASGTRIPRTAESSFNASALYTRPFNNGLAGFARAGFSYVGGATSRLTSSTETDSYSLFDARLGVRSDRWEISLFADNLFDEDVQTFIAPSPDLGTGNDVLFWGEPRTIGVTVRFSD